MENPTNLKELYPNHVEIIFLKDDLVHNKIKDIIGSFRNEDLNTIRNLSLQVDNKNEIFSESDFRNNFKVTSLFEKYVSKSFGLENKIENCKSVLDTYLAPFEATDIICYELFFHNEDLEVSKNSTVQNISDYEGNYLVFLDEANSKKLMKILVADKVIDEQCSRMLNNSKICTLLKLKD